MASLPDVIERVDPVDFTADGRPMGRGVAIVVDGRAHVMSQRHALEAALAMCHAATGTPVEAVTSSEQGLRLILSAVNAALGTEHTSAYEAVQALVAERERMLGIVEAAEKCVEAGRLVDEASPESDAFYDFCGELDDSIDNLRAALKGGGK